MKSSDAKNRVRVFCDVHPMHSNLWSLSDFSGVRIFSLCALPLTRHNERNGSILPLGASYWEHSEDFRYWNFHINPEFFWDDGTPITGFDYARGLNYLASNNNHCFRSLISDVQGFNCNQIELDGIRAFKNSISFELRNPNRIWPTLLSFLSASPRHYSDAHQFPGVYKLEKQSNEQFLLKIRDSFLNKEKNPIQEISITFNCENEDFFAIQSWEKKVIDMTWDLYFPYSKCNLYKNIKEFWHSTTKVIVLLSPQGCDYAPSSELMRYIYSKIDRNKLMAELHNYPSPLYGYFLKEKLNLSDVNPTSKHVELKISYEDFYPNFEILMNIKQQMEPLGIIINPVKVNYSERPTSIHLRLELKHNPIPDHFLLFRNELALKQFKDHHPEAWKDFANLFTQYQIGKSQDPSRLASEMDSILIKEGRMIPLITLPGFYLCNNSIGYHCFEPGQIWRWADA